MNESKQRHNLGRGLAALFGEDAAEEAAERGLREAPIELLHPNPRQPRQRFETATIDELAASIKANGLLQPILVRPHPERPGAFEIVAGERRWRAAQQARLHAVPVVVRALDNEQVLEAALVENLQRQDLSAIEEAEALQRLIDEFGHTQEKLAAALGKSRSHVANTLRLLGLPRPVKEMVLDGRLSAGHARALVTAKDPQTLAQKAIALGLSVRQTERLAGEARGAARKAKTAQEKDADTLALERDLTDRLGLKVQISFDGQGGTLAIRYRTLEQLDDLVARLSGSN